MAEEDKGLVAEMSCRVKTKTLHPSHPNESTYSLSTADATTLAVDASKQKKLNLNWRSAVSDFYCGRT